MHFAISIHTPAKGVTAILIGSGGRKSISIHTPAKGVTDIHYDRGQDKLRISIHTPAKGVTQVMVAGKGGVAYFNPHSRKGSDMARDIGEGVFR